MTGPRDLLLFQVGLRIFATAVEDAVRIGSVRDSPADSLVLDSALGRPFSRERGIIVAGEQDHEEHTLVIDEVLGVRHVGDHELKPLPAFAEACLGLGAVRGFVLLDESPLPIVDLPTVVRERLVAAHP
ncbi:MAG: chemotaxis protein CheW [Anaeromyxobacteraceae bacterium]